MKTNMQWALYARKSTESEDRQVQSIDDQVVYLNDLARRENLHVAEIITEAKSAKAPDVRPGFRHLLELIEKGKIQGVLCWKGDRLSRNPIDGGRLQWLLQTSKIKCIRASDRSYWPEDNALLFAVEQGMANQYVRDLSKNVKRGLHSKADKGWYPSIPPIGYLNSKNSDQGRQEIVTDTQRFPIVHKMWQLMLTGNYTAMEVLRIATDEWKLDTPKRRLNGKKPIVPSYIYKLFTNVFYTGNFMYAGKFYAGKHRAMITMDEFDKVQMMLGKKGQPRPKIHDFPFTGIMRCANCNASITATQKYKLVKCTGEFKKYTYYHCTRRMGIDDCKAPAVTLSELEAQIEKLLLQNAISSEFYQLGIEMLKANEGQQFQEFELVYARQLQFVKDLQRKLDRLLGFLLNETISEEEYGAQKRELERQLAIEKVKLDQSEQKNADYDRLLKNAFTFSRAGLHAFKNGDVQTRREIMASLGSNHKLNEKILCIDMHSWLETLKKAENEIKQEAERFELKRSDDSKAIAAFKSFSPLMCGLVDKVRTEFMESHQPPDIPDLSKWLETTR